eukprot:13536402-Alexandrium_andersonii.AAC.2
MDPACLKTAPRRCGMGRMDAIPAALHEVRSPTRGDGNAPRVPVLVHNARLEPRLRWRSVSSGHAKKMLTLWWLVGSVATPNPRQTEASTLWTIWLSCSPAMSGGSGNGPSRSESCPPTLQCGTHGCLWLTSIPIREDDKNTFKTSRLEQRSPVNDRENCSPKLPTGAFCGIFRADAESADETGRRTRRRRFGGWGSRGRSPPRRLMITLADIGVGSDTVADFALGLVAACARSLRSRNRACGRSCSGVYRCSCPCSLRWHCGTA